MTNTRGWLASCLFVALFGCAGTARPASAGAARAKLAGSRGASPPRPPSAPRIARCSYRIELRASGRVKVHADCTARGPVTYLLSGQELLSAVHAVGARGEELRPPFKTSDGKLDYEVDLAQLANERKSFDVALRVGASFMAPMSSLLLVPEPLTTDIPVEVAISAEADLAFATGLARGPTPGNFRLEAHEITVSTYLAFGKLEERVVTAQGGRITLVGLDGHRDLTLDEYADWLRIAAAAVADFYGTFPMPEATVTLVPIPRQRGVLFGKVLPESAPGIVLVAGEHAQRSELDDDWMLVHELFHLGFPSFYDEGKWLDEGLATYYEPIIRVRARLYGERELWGDLFDSMPQGMAAFTRRGLEHSSDFKGTYWGGAIACLIADVEARKQGDPERGLEVGLRALREAGGVANEVWSLADAVAAIDRALGRPTLGPIALAHAEHGSAFDLGALWAELGVSRGANGKLVLDDEAPLAHIRRAIARPPARP